MTGMLPRLLAPIVIALALLLSAAVPAAAQERRPLAVPDVPEFYQRVLTLPDAVYAPGPGASPASDAKKLPVFSVLYVYDRRTAGGATWLEVGAKAAGGGEGWLPEDKTQEWRTMLVMQYAPRSVRERVLMFKERGQLEAVVRADNATALAKQDLADIASGKSDPNTVLAIEPATPVDYGKKPYVMPILDWKADQFADDTNTLLLQLASVNAQKPPESKTDTPPPPDLSRFKIAVVFLVDTTMSMQPYIDRVRGAIQHIYDGLEADNTLSHVDFGLVAYRNTLAKDKRVEYVTRIYQPLDPKTDPKTLLANLGQIAEAKVQTPGWDEDAFAGMYDALNQLDWAPYQAKIIITVSDAGAVGGNSPYAHYPGLGLGNIVELAGRKGVAFFPVYLQTPEGDRHQAERRRAIGLYKVLGSQTGDPAIDKFTLIPAGSVDTFGATTNAFVDKIRAAVKGVAANQMVRVVPPPVVVPSGPDTPHNNAPAAPDPSATMTQALVNEIFRSQIEYIGSQQGTAAPPFFRAWSSDLDLTQPKYRALDVRVFLTRNQLNGLAQSLKGVLDAGKQASLAQETFFDLLRSLSATMAGDPNRRAPGDFTNLADSNLLPSYLKILPYKSKLLRLGKETWTSLGLTGQQEMIDELEYKLKQYQDMYQDTQAWTDFGSGDPGQAVYPVPLATLP